jgi:hypothetical protein
LVDSDSQAKSEAEADPDATAAALCGWVQSPDSELETTSFQTDLSNSPAAAAAAALRTAMMELDAQFWMQADDLPETKSVDDDTLYLTMTDEQIAALNVAWEQTYAKAYRLFDERFQVYSNLLARLHTC